MAGTQKAVIPDQEHTVDVSAVDRRALVAWLQHGTGSYHTGRVTFEAVEGGGMLIRTRPL